MGGGNDPAPRAPARVKSAVVRVRDQFVLARFGKLARDRYRAAASADLARLLATPGDSWVPFEHFVEATRLVCELFGDGSPTLARAVGAYGAEANMGAWRSLVHRLLSPRLLVDIAGKLWSHHYDGGRLISQATGERSIHVCIADFPAPSVFHCTSIEGWCERTIQHSRPKAARVWQVSCRARGDSSCDIRGEWE